MQIEEGRFETTTPLLRADQIEDMGEEAKRLQGMLDAPPHIRSAIQDRGAATKTLRRLQNELERQAPTKYKTNEIDAAKKRADLLLQKITSGMPTQAEMRRNPPGAVDKHRSWENRNKKDILEWKNIQRRLLVSGHLGSLKDAREVANIERYRPEGGSQELAMDGAQIQGKEYHLPPPGAAPSVIITDAHRAVLKQHAPDLLVRIALMDNEQRAELVQSIEALMETPSAVPQKPTEVAQKGEDGRGAWQGLLKEARSLGIEPRGMKREEVEAAIAEKQEV